MEIFLSGFVIEGILIPRVSEMAAPVEALASVDMMEVLTSSIPSNFLSDKSGVIHTTLFKLKQVETTQRRF